MFGNPIMIGTEPGILTLRAQGSIVFNGALSDGFGDGAGNMTFDINGNPALWLQQLLPLFEDRTAQQSWSYKIVSGADLSAADVLRVQPLSNLPNDSGSLLLGTDAGTNISNPPGPGGVVDTAILGHYQVIRTGTGDIDIVAGRDVRFLNQFATIYTAGTRVADPTLNGTFDVPRLSSDPISGFPDLYPAQYTLAGGNVAIRAQNDIIHLTRDGSGQLIADSGKELPMNWLYRRGYVDAGGVFGTGIFGDVASTTWWIDFSNFFEGVGTLGGGNVTLIAGHDVSNVDAVAATNARMPGKDSNGNPIAPNANSLLELGGGDVTVRAGNDIDGGVYYVERGTGTLSADNRIHTNATRSPYLPSVLGGTLFPEQSWLPTTLFLGKGSFDVTARGDLLLGPVANPFLLPGGLHNTYWYKTYFSTSASTDSVNVSSLSGSVSLREGASATLPTGGPSTPIPILEAWLQNMFLLTPFSPTTSFYQPWLQITETIVDPFATVSALLPPTLRATAFSGDINLTGRFNLLPAPTGTLDLLAEGALNALQPNGGATAIGLGSVATWSTSAINVSDADPNALPGISSPFAYQSVVGNNPSQLSQTLSLFLAPVDIHFDETGSSAGAAGVLQTKQALHAPGLLHLNDPNPVHIYANTGNLSGLTLFSPKATRIVSGRDIVDIAFYLQNLSPNDVSVVSAGRDLVAYDPNSPLRSAAQTGSNVLSPGSTSALAGDIQINGPGTLEVLTGRNLDLGVGPNNPDGTAVGLTSIGNGRNPYLPFSGADIIASAGVSGTTDLSTAASLDFGAFISQFLDPSSSGTNSARYLPDLATLLGLANATDAQTWTAFQQLSNQDQARFALDLFYLVLRDAGRDHNDPSSPNFGSYTNGFAAIAALFPDGGAHAGNISLTSREIKTTNGGNIGLLAPGGELDVGLNVAGAQAADQGILTQHGGNINIFTYNSVNVGTSRIFTLRGGNEIIWSTVGDIAAGSSSKTVLAAPPTRVLIDPQSADVETDLAGLATGGGIGVLQEVAGIPPADVDLIAPNGTINAGDAGIRVSGNLNLAALVVLNATNISVGGTSTGIPTVAAPNISGLTNASNTVAASSNAAQQLAQNNAAQPQADVPSIISVEVLGYGGGSDDSDEERRRKSQQQQQQHSTSAEQGFRVSEIQRWHSGDSLQ